MYNEILNGDSRTTGLTAGNHKTSLLSSTALTIIIFTKLTRLP